MATSEKDLDAQRKEIEKKQAELQKLRDQREAHEAGLVNEQTQELLDAEQVRLDRELEFERRLAEARKETKSSTKKDDATGEVK
jgi:peptidoglycan hydrolase CwlO-like protein